MMLGCNRFLWSVTNEKKLENRLLYVGPKKCIKNKNTGGFIVTWYRCWTRIFINFKSCRYKNYKTKKKSKKKCSYLSLKRLWCLKDLSEEPSKSWACVRSARYCKDLSEEPLKIEHMSEELVYCKDLSEEPSKNCAFVRSALYDRKRDCLKSP